MSKRACIHEPTVTITAAHDVFTSIICPCRNCGRLQEFFWRDDHKPRAALRLLPRPREAV